MAPESRPASGASHAEGVGVVTHPNCPCGHRPTDHYEDTRAMNMACRMCDCRSPIRRINAPFFREHAVTLVESLAIAMADAEGNAEAAVRGLWTNYDALGYGRLAKAALDELRRLQLLPGAPTADAATGTDGSP